MIPVRKGGGYGSSSGSNQHVEKGAQREIYVGVAELLDLSEASVKRI